MSIFAIPQKCDIPKNAYGVFQIPELDIIIPIYSGTTATAQDIIDRKYSACIESMRIGYVINDHAESLTKGKGKWCINEVTPDTKAFLVTKDKTISYTCVYVCRAIRQTHAYILDGKEIWPARKGDIFCVSCAEYDASEVYIAEFKMD